MTEIHPTNFVHEPERHDETIASDAPYTLFETVVEHLNSDGNIERLGRDMVLRQMENYATRLDLRPPYTVPLGGADTHSVGEVIDTKAINFLEEVNGMTPAPEAMIGILTTVAELAERSGYDRDKAIFRASFMYPTSKGNPNLNIHSDGLSGLVKEDTTKAKCTRFVYAIGPGTLIFPKIDKVGELARVDYTSESGFALMESPAPLNAINSPRVSEFTEEELVAGGAQQVVPGVILGFDPTRTFWHQAHDAPRPILTIDIQQAS
ncbi:hypothetical protein BH10PAT3_BH10PAT3_1900 [soil metagenome]